MNNGVSDLSIFPPARLKGQGGNDHPEAEHGIMK
jgi:hypothetical protein